MNSVELTVKSELYGTTTCVVDVPTFLQGRRIFPCGDGCDYKLKSSDVALIKDYIKTRS